MRLKNLFGALALLFTVACGLPPRPPVITPPPVVTPPPATAPSVVAADFVACKDIPVNNYCNGMPGATFAIEIGPNVWRTYFGDNNGYVFANDLPNIGDSRITIAAHGYITLGPQHLDINHSPAISTDVVAVNARQCSNGANCHNMWLLTPLEPPFPAPKSRADTLNLHITGQGMMVNTQQFGTLPWWEAALTYLGPSDRAEVYRQKHASQAWPGGDTHAIIAVPSGRALYDEPNQPYSADRFPPLDWTNGATSMVPEFNELVIELITNGFTPMIFLDETMDTSYKTLPVVINALQHSRKGDLTPYVVIGPGWDGVFYGWEPSHQVIPQWAANGRAACPACYFFIEHNVGHIPLGEGPSDWTPTGLAKDFDLLLSEFFDGVFDDTVYQIAGRTIRPYFRPADQVGDPNPPYYMQGNLRSNGQPQPACAFEFAMYGFVHGNGQGTSNPENIVLWRNRLKALGYTCGG